MKIVQLTAENVKRLVAVEITPQGSLTIVGGMNAQGKTSVLDSIEYALCGKRSIPAQPLRKGEKEGKIEVKLDGDPARLLAPLIVTRLFHEDGSTELEVRTDDKYKALAPSPQTILDQLVGRLGFDPLTFCRLQAKEQVKALRELVGLDFSDLDAEYKRIYEERSRVNAQGKSLKAQYDAVPPNTQAKEVSTEQIASKLEAAEEIKEAKREAESKLQRFSFQVKTTEDHLLILARKLAELEADIKAEQNTLVTLKADYAKAEVSAKNAPDVDTAAIRKELESADLANLEYRKKQARVKMGEELEGLRDTSKKLSDQLKQIEQTKEKLMAEAKWPVSGLGFGSDGVTLNGLPFEQASQAEQLKVSVGIGAALNPTLRVLMIRDGSLLDDQSLIQVAQIAAENDLQVFMERVGEGEECSVIIEEGKVKDV